MKQILFSYLTFLFSLGILAQNINIVQQKTFGGRGKDSFKTIIHTADNGYMVLLNSNSGISYDKSDNNRGNWDYWLVKFDADFNEVWQKTIGGKKRDVAYKLLALSNGTYLIGGTSSSGISGDKTVDKIGMTDFWVINISADGEILWQQVYGGYKYEELEDMIELSDGNILVSGYSYSNRGGYKMEDCRGSADYWLIKIAPDGNPIWDKTMGGSGLDAFPKILEDSQGRLYVIGQSTSKASGEKSDDAYWQEYSALDDIWMLKLDPEGNILWDKTIGSNDFDRLGGTIYYQDHLYIAVSSSGWGYEKSTPPYGGYSYDYWLVKMDLEGNILWDKTIGGSSMDIVRDIMVSGDNELLLTGHSKSEASYDKSEANIGEEDYWLVKVNTDGDILWEKTIGGETGDEYRNQTIRINQNELVLAGSSKSSIGGDKTEDCRGETDLWMLKLDISTGLEQLNAQATISVYPNPAKEHIVLQGLEHPQDIALFNSQGQLLKTIKAYQPNTALDISNLPRGVYLLKTHSGSFKFVK